MGWRGGRRAGWRHGLLPHGCTALLDSAHHACNRGLLSQKPDRPLSHPPTHPTPQVLGRSEFKQLLRWRLLIKKDLQRATAAAAKAAKEAGEGGEEGEEGQDSEEEEDPEEKLLREMSEVKDR